MTPIILATLIALSLPVGAMAEDPTHFTGRGTATLRHYGPYGPIYCTFAADVEVESLTGKIAMYGDRTVFAYTLRALIPDTANDPACLSWRPRYYSFRDTCRAFTTSIGTIGIDIPRLGAVLVRPNDPGVRAAFGRGATNDNNGFGVTVVDYAMTPVFGGVRILGVE